MKRLLAPLCALILAPALFASADITVEGRGTVKLPPDGMRITFTVSAVDPDMAASKRLFAEKNAAMAAALEAAGVDKERELKITNIAMRPRYEWQHKNGEGRQVFKGYENAVDYLFAAPLDRDRLEKVYDAIVASKAGQDFGVAFELRDMEAARAEARRRAVRNAEAIARDLAATLNLALDRVEGIRYGAMAQSDVKAYGVMARAANFADEAEGGAFLPDLSLRDIEISETVYVSWDLR